MFIATDWVSSSWIVSHFFAVFYAFWFPIVFAVSFFAVFLAFCFAVCLLFFTVFFQCFSFFGSPACSACSSAEFSHLYQWGQEHWQVRVKIMSRTCGNAFSLWQKQGWQTTPLERALICWFFQHNRPMVRKCKEGYNKLAASCFCKSFLVSE